MGINIQVHVMYGIKREWEDNQRISDFNETVYDEHYDDPDTPDVVLDGMGGRYAIFGKILWRSDDFRYCDGEGDPLTELDFATLPAIEKEYKEAFVKKFPEYADLVDGEFNLVVFTHYS